MSAGTHYLDHAATTPLLRAAATAVQSAWAETGNPSSVHASGRRARRLVEEAREQIAASIEARPVEVVLTSGGTEADNLAVKGLFWSRRGEDPRRRRVLVAAHEHQAVLDPAGWLSAHEGAEIEPVPVDADGVVQLDALADAINRDPATVAMVCCQWANNEVGTVQPVDEVVALAHVHGIAVHSDAVQAVGPLRVDFAASGVDSLTLSGHKLGAPVGVGALIVRRGVDVTPLLHGGGQERDLRSGTVPVASVRGLAAGISHAVAARPVETLRLAGLRDDLERRVRKLVPDVEVAAAPQRLPGISHLTFPGCDGDALLMLLDARGVQCSTGAACSAGVPRPSHVLLAMGRDDVAASSALRVSLGHTSTQSDVDAFVDAIGPAVERARSARSAVLVGRR